MTYPLLPGTTLRTTFYREAFSPASPLSAITAHPLLHNRLRCKGILHLPYSHANSKKQAARKSGNSVPRATAGWHRTRHHRHGHCFVAATQRWFTQALNRPLFHRIRPVGEYFVVIALRSNRQRQRTPEVCARSQALDDRPEVVSRLPAKLPPGALVHIHAV